MDQVIINTRERPYSPDVMNMQSVLNRTLADLLLYQHSQGFNPNSSAAANNVCYGLAVSAGVASGNSYVTVTPGVLLQQSSTLVPTPGSLDSTYRMGVNRTALRVDKPTVLSLSWYLLEAQVSTDVASTELRDIMDEVTGVFVAANVTKRKESGITTQWSAGSSTQLPAPSGGDWVTLGGYLMQAGGDILLDADAVDLRPTAKARPTETRQGWSRAAVVPVLRTVATPSATSSFNIRLAVDHAHTNQDAGTGYGGGLDLRVGDSGNSLNSFDAQASAVLEPGTTLADSTWYYLYLCPWYDVAPDSSLQGPDHTRGVLVLSATAPEVTGLFNSAELALPPPFSTYAVPAYQAPCVGALRCNAAADGWDPMSGGSGEYRMTSNIGTNTCYALGSAAALTIPSDLIPANAKTLEWQARGTMSGTSADVVIIEIGDAGIAYGEGWDAQDWDLAANESNVLDPVRLRVPRWHSAAAHVQMTVRTFGSYSIVLTGYTT